MSQKNVQVVRQPVRVSERMGRTLDERLLMRFPRLADAFARLLSTLPPRSRFRRAALGRAVKLGSEAYNRRDLDALLLGYHNELEYFPGREWVKADLLSRAIAATMATADTLRRRPRSGAMRTTSCRRS